MTQPTIAPRRLSRPDPHPTRCTLSWNWAWVLALVTLWVYGLYGAVYGVELTGAIKAVITSPSHAPIRAWLVVGFSLAVFAVFMSLTILGRRTALFDQKLNLGYQDGLVFASYLAMLVLTVPESVMQSIAGDGLYHAKNAHIHSLWAMNWLSQRWTAIDDAPGWVILLLINGIAVGCLTVAGRSMRRWRLGWSLIVLGSLFWLGRLFLTHSDVHPHFRLFPLWLAGACLGPSDWSFRLPQLIGLAVLGWCLYRRLRRTAPWSVAWLFGAAVVTIPVLWHSGSLVEQSIWTAILWTLLILDVAEDRLDQPQVLGRWCAILAIGTLMRITVFLGWLPWALMWIGYGLKHRDRVSFGQMCLVILPALVAMPFLVKSITLGTPALMVPSETYELIPADTGTLGRIVYAARSGLAWNVIEQSVQWPWLAFLALAFIPGSVRSVWRSAVIILFFVAAFGLFYSIRPVLWGLGRYQAEYIVPFAVYGCYRVIRWLNNQRPWTVPLCAMLLVGLTAGNVYVYLNLPGYTKPLDTIKATRWQEIKRGGVVILSETIYDYRKAFQQARKDGYADHVYLYGPDDQVFAKLLAGYTVQQLASAQTMVKRFGDNPVRPQTVHKNEQIKVVLIATADHLDAIRSFERLGWRRWKDFENTRWESTLFGMIRGITETELR